jgi:hypothetical protein
MSFWFYQVIKIRLVYHWIKTKKEDFRIYYKNNYSFLVLEGPSWLWSNGSWIYNYLCNQSLSLLRLWVRIPLRWGVLDTTLCDKVCQYLRQLGGFLWVHGFLHSKTENLIFVSCEEKKWLRVKNQIRYLYHTFLSLL